VGDDHAPSQVGVAYGANAFRHDAQASISSPESVSSSSATTAPGGPSGVLITLPFSTGEAVVQVSFSERAVDASRSIHSAKSRRTSSTLNSSSPCARRWLGEELDHRDAADRFRY